MARWYRSGRYYGRNRGYRRRTSYYNRSIRSKSWGNMKAAKQQADQSTFTINVPSTLEAANYPSANPIDTTKIVNYGVYPLNIFEQLRKSEFYQSYASMYDEFKIDRIKVKLLPTEFTYTATAGSNGSGTYKNVTVYTAWDRTGLSKDQLVLIATELTESSDKIGTITPSDDGDGLYCIIGNDITTYSSSESRVINPGTNTSIVRWLNPKTMDEKGQWVSTGLLRKWYDGYTNGHFYGIPTGKVDANRLLTNYGDVEIGDTIIPTAGGADPDPTIQRAFLNHLSSANRDNPCYLLEDTGFKFKPTLLIGIYPESTSTNLCKFNVETEVVCTFRGLRKANVVAALYDKEHGSDDDDDDVCEDNTILINLTNENIITSKNNEENIILPSEYWDSRVNTSTTIPFEDQEWFNEVEINTDGIIIKELEKLTDKQLTQNNLVNGKITVSNLMVDNQNKDGITKDSTLIPKLTTVTNKRLTSSSVTVSDIINDSTSLGLSRTSTLILDPPVNYGFANITSNGQYLPSDFNSSGVYDPTHSAGWDYIDQINVNVPPVIIDVTDLSTLNYNEITKYNWHNEAETKPSYYSISGYKYFLLDETHNQITISATPYQPRNGTAYRKNCIFLNYIIKNNATVITNLKTLNETGSENSNFLYDGNKTIIIQSITYVYNPKTNHLNYKTNSSYWKIGNLLDDFSDENGLYYNFVLSNYNSIPFENVS